MRWRAFASLVSLATLVAGCQVGSTANAAPDIVIASDLPLAAFPGLGASYVTAVQQAIGFAVRKQGSIGGFRLGYWSLDDSLAATANPVRGVENVERMIADRRVVGMIGPFASIVAYQQLPVANRAELAMISPSNTDPCLTIAFKFCAQSPAELRPNGVNNYFRIAAPDPLQGRAMARYINATLNIKRVAVLNEWSYYGDEVVAEFGREFTQAGGVLVLNEDFDGGTTNFAPFLERAKAKGAQAIYAVGNSEFGVCAVRDPMSTLLPDAYLLGVDGLGLGNGCIDQAGGAQTAEGLVETRLSVDPTSSPSAAIKARIDAYRRAHPNASDVSEYTFAAYDCTRILIDAIGRAIQAKHGGLPTRAEVIVALAQTKDFQGLTGTYSFGASGDALSPLMSIYQVRRGKWVYVEKIDVSLRSERVNNVRT